MTRYDFAAAGRLGAAARVDTPTVRRGRDMDTTCTLALQRIARGLPLDERRWSLEALAFWVRLEWPKPRSGYLPTLRTLEAHLRALIAAGRLSPVEAWPE